MGAACMSRSRTDAAPAPASQPTTTRPSGIILAGGRSRRMGRDKCALEVGGRTLIQRVADALDEVCGEIILVHAPDREPPELHSRAPVRHVADPFEDAGPLVAIAEGLEAASSPVAIAVGCDAPQLRPALLRLLAEWAQAGRPLVAPLHEGVPQWLCAAWRRDALPVLRERIAAGDRAVHDAAEALEAALLPPEAYAHLDPAGDSFLNVNTPEQLAKARAAVGQSTSRSAPA
ncbi:MAG: molybdenum cofactor guanylyltransferase [Chloroflexi bacterium]|nr:molybdenum cofactor guanylyltransferase [Chloroflexota bacterium]